MVYQLCHVMWHKQYNFLFFDHIFVFKIFFYILSFFCISLSFNDGLQHIVPDFNIENLYVKVKISSDLYFSWAKLIDINMFYNLIYKNIYWYIYFLKFDGHFVCFLS